MENIKHKNVILDFIETFKTDLIDENKNIDNKLYDFLEKQSYDKLLFISNFLFIKFSFLQKYKKYFNIYNKFLGFKDFEIHNNKIKMVEYEEPDGLLLFSSEIDNLDFNTGVSLKIGKYFYLLPDEKILILTICKNLDEFPFIIKKYKNMSELPKNFQPCVLYKNSFTDLFNTGINFEIFILRFLNYIKLQYKLSNNKMNIKLQNGNNFISNPPPKVLEKMNTEILDAFDI